MAENPSGVRATRSWRVTCLVGHQMASLWLVSKHSVWQCRFLHSDDYIVGANPGLNLAGKPCGRALAKKSAPVVLQ